MSDRIHRRRFIGESMLAGAGLSLAGCSTAGTKVLAETAPKPRPKGPAKVAANEKLNIGIIGVNHRVKANTKGVKSENIVALCDIDANYLAEAAVEFPQAKQYKDWRKLLDDREVDAVVIRTADHHHALAAVKAMRECNAEGHIVNISSIASQRSDSGVYGSTKHAVNAISSSLRGELEEDTIRVVNVMPGAIATNFARNFEPAFVEGFVKMAGLDHEVKKGERLPDEVFEKLSSKLRNLLGDPADVANAILYAVTQPIYVDIADIVVRPAKQMNF